MNRFSRYIKWALAVSAVTLSGCSDSLPWDNGGLSHDNVINVGAETSGLAVSSSVSPLGQTRAAGEVKDAETVPWLVQPLKKGLDITYGQVGMESETERVAILKLLGGGEDDLYYDTDSQSGYAKYSFNYRGADGTVTNEKAHWYDNGPHYFEGVHVPYRLRFHDSAEELESDHTIINGTSTTVKAVKNLVTDQSGDQNTGSDNDLGNYTLLSHYLGMPANTRISATVGRIKLPFRHRLAHVMAYIIIDPELKACIKGYDLERDNEGTITKPDNPVTSSIRFCYVDVLKGVKDVYDPATQLHTLTPHWAERVRKVTPHFWGEVGSITVYRSEKEEIYPGNSKYETVAANPAGYTPVVYNNVPVYDLIVRPTYTSYDNVMYDEEGYGNETTRQALADRTNMIGFDITLDNGLVYQKDFEFDLDANYETVVYLHITPKGISYKDSGSAVWDETIENDFWYGIDNKNGNKLSIAGSSWQRAYTRRKDSYINDGGDKVTDGGYYDEGTDGEDDATGQYLSQKTWIKYFSEAYEGGAHHGDYFNLSLDMTIDARMLPDNFVFTGHLDAFGEDDNRYHTITLTNTGMDWKEYTETIDYSLYPNLYTEKPEADYSNDETSKYVMPELYRMTAEAVLYDATNCVEIEGKWYDMDDVVLQPSDPPVYTLKDENVQPVTLGTVKTPAVYEKVTLTLAELMASSETFYTRVGTAYSEYERPQRFYTIKQHKSPSWLFAGLDGVYSTRQEIETGYAGEWEANVHKETNKTTGKTYWLPYKEDDNSSGWRAEVLNLTLTGGTIFKPFAVITGNVQNCKDVSGRVDDHTPALPKYK